ncbi:NUDIX hydrolase [Pseudonocardia oceani]|uniref:NUDIX hydrolase n=1 Tax=Pseudonocardia oceani TaxID=2792013 RepID=UPI001CF61008|nr:NUDIX hydrolase [Pseudonocardia oceani]
MTTLPVLLVLAALACVVALAAARVRRLHRLHIRVDAARAGLDAALRRRAEAAVCAGGALGEAAAAAARASGVDAEREAVENDLGRRLAVLDRAALPEPLRTELAEAERYVVLGRSVYHDAVRDTLDLRSRRLVRWLRLAGTAPLPAYLDIAVTSAAAGRAAPGPDVGSSHRPA